MKLTKYIKEQMVHALMVHSKLPEQTKQAEIALKEQGDKVYDLVMDKYLKHLKAIPPEFFTNSTSFSVKLSDKNINFSTKNSRPKMSWSGLLPERLDLSATHDTIVEYIRLHKLYEDACTKEQTAKQQTEGMLASINTYNQLCETWQEAIPVVSKFYQPKNNALVPTTLTQINTALGLTTPTQKPKK